MAPAGFVVTLDIFLAFTSSFSNAYDYLQDFCVAVPDPTAAVFVNGKVCKNPKQVTADDFLATGFNTPGITTSLGYAVKAANVNQIPGLNTLGLSVIRHDIAPGGVTPPHMHASELILVLEGTVYFGFVTSNTNDNTKSRLFAKILKPGDVFVIPIGVVHFGRNVGKTNATVIAAFNSENPGILKLPQSVFGTQPKISPEVLTK